MIIACWLHVHILCNYEEESKQTHSGVQKSENIGHWSQKLSLERATSLATNFRACGCAVHIINQFAAVKTAVWWWPFNATPTHTGPDRRRVIIPCQVKTEAVSLKHSHSHTYGSLQHVQHRPTWKHITALLWMARCVRLSASHMGSSCASYLKHHRHCRMKLLFNRGKWVVSFSNTIVFKIFIHSSSCVKGKQLRDLIRKAMGVGEKIFLCQLQHVLPLVEDLKDKCLRNCLCFDYASSFISVLLVLSYLFSSPLWRVCSCPDHIMLKNRPLTVRLHVVCVESSLGSFHNNVWKERQKV